MGAADEIGRILFRKFNEQDARLRTGKSWLAHYTTAENALNIINGGEFWLRQPVLMNDIREIEHGDSCLRHAFNTHGTRLKAVLDGAAPGTLMRAADAVWANVKNARRTIFLASLCEHDPADEAGTLSMWRAYGGKAGVAIVLDPVKSLDVDGEEDSEAQIASANYCAPDDFAASLGELTTELEKSVDLLKEVDPAHLQDILTARFEFDVYTAKHSGFSEEREWRMIFRPGPKPSERIKLETVSIGGIPLGPAASDGDISNWRK